MQLCKEILERIDDAVQHNFIGRSGLSLWTLAKTQMTKTQKSPMECYLGIRCMGPLEGAQQEALL